MTLLYLHGSRYESSECLLTVVIIRKFMQDKREKIYGDQRREDAIVKLQFSHSLPFDCARVNLQEK